MKTIEYKNPDTAKEREGWPVGNWDGEPDKKQWLDAATGLPCLIVRNRMGALCGYVGVSPGHPFYQKPYDDLDVNVHGGLTFADSCQEHPGAEESGICHLPEEGEEKNVWWFGFDCAHYGDYIPSMDALRRKYREELGHLSSGEVYRDIGYVTAEVEYLAKQLAAMKPLMLEAPRG